MASEAGAADRIQRRSLHDEVVERLRGMIVEGELPAGQRIPERVLCERFGISRTPLREALKVLATEGTRTPPIMPTCERRVARAAA